MKTLELYCDSEDFVDTMLGVKTKFEVAADKRFKNWIPCKVSVESLPKRITQKDIDTALEHAGKLTNLSDDQLEVLRKAFHERLKRD